MRRALPLTGLSGVAWLMLGCSAPDSASSQSTACLVAGGSKPELLLLSERQINANVGLVFAEGTETGVCSGIVIGASTVLTAAHCASRAEHGELKVIVGTSLACPSASLSGRVLRAHDSLDVALVEVRDLPKVTAVEALPWSLQALEPDSIGELVQLAGFGTDLWTPPNERRFIAEAIEGVSEDRVEVDGHGRSGTCLGDSGGAMLARDEGGAPVVLGVLSEGADSCVGADAYVRLDALDAWLSPQVARPLTSSACGAIPTSGACFNGRALRCVAGALSAEICEPNEFCGWTRADRYGCLSAEETACGTLDQLGECRGSIARRCVQGALVEDDCQSLGTSCARSAVSGSAECRAL